MTNPELLERWRGDEAALAAIGAVLFEQDTSCRIRLPLALAEQAVAAWHRDDEGVATDEDTEHEVVRERAAALALLGAQLEVATEAAPAEVEATLDAWYIGVALGAADDHDLLGPASGPTVTGLATPDTGLGTPDPDRPPATAGHDLSPTGFSLWLEFEHVAEPIDDFCNVGVTCSDGTAYALNVWTFDYVQTLAEGRAGDDGGELVVGYTRAPDLLVRALTRHQLTAAVTHLLANGGLPAACRLPAG